MVFAACEVRIQSYRAPYMVGPLTEPLQTASQFLPLGLQLPGDKENLFREEVLDLLWQCFSGKNESELLATQASR